MDRIQPNISLLRRFSPDAGYLVGVSGGRDSIALLHQLVGLGYKRLIICHLNHHLRGRSSDADARFVKKLTLKYSGEIVGQALRLPNPQTGRRGACPTMPNTQIDIEIRTVDVRALAAKNKISIEEAAREARYKFFAEVAKRNRCGAIFLAHHADDLVETFLINLFRGAGMTGLGAIREVAIRRIKDLDLTVVRPLLGVWRSDIDKYVRAHRLKFREDTSNRDLAPLRNRIRHRVIPYLEKTLGRNVRQNIWRTATIAAEEENFFESLLPERLESTALAVEPLRKMAPALQRRMLRKWLCDAAVQEVSFDLIERVRSLLDLANRVAKTNLPRDRHVRRSAGKLFIQ